MNKYSLQVVYDYIMGKEIIDYDLCELENDAQFMMMVINATNDKKMYNLCSDELKNDPEFVKYLINKFHNDIKFITMVAKTYLSNYQLKNQQDIIEIRLLISKYTMGIMDAFPLECRCFLESFYLKKRIIYDECIKACSDSNNKDLYGMGYFIVLDEYGDSELLKNYFAMRMLMDIFKIKEGSSLEKLIHNRFNNRDELIKLGINNFLLQYIADFDLYLSNYIAIHIDLIANLKKQVIYYIDNDRWHLYEVENEKITIENILNDVLCFFKEYYAGIDNYDGLLEYIANEFGILPLFMKYDFYFKYYIEHKSDIEYRCVETFNEKELPFKTYIKLMNLKMKINEILSNDISYNNSLVVDDSKKCKILKIDFNNKKYRY